MHDHRAEHPAIHASTGSMQVIWCPVMGFMNVPRKVLSYSQTRDRRVSRAKIGELNPKASSNNGKKRMLTAAEFSNFYPGNSSVWISGKSTTFLGKFMNLTTEYRCPWSERSSWISRIIEWMSRILISGVFDALIFQEICRIMKTSFGYLFIFSICMFIC